MRGRSARHILITGRPGVGKTTLLKGLALALGGRAAGFYTEEIRQAGGRQGFDLVLWPSGARAPLARRAESRGAAGPRVGRYVVDLRGLEELGVGALRSAALDAGVRVVLVDEIGRMELLSTAFRRVVGELFAGSKTVVATARAAPDPFVDRLKEARGTETFVLTAAGRSGALEMLLGRVTALLAAPPEARQ